MLELKHTATDRGPMVVHARDTRCDCTWSVKVPAEDRIGGTITYPEVVGRTRVKALKSPKDWYRMAENVLLVTGKVTTLTVRNRVGQEIHTLRCKEHGA